MPTPKPPLLQYERNIHSQYGEDGVLAYALGRLPARDKWCVEFGAWDGKYCSNTCALIESSDFSAVLIECDPKKIEVLRQTHLANKKVHIVCRLVGFDGPDILDKILAETPIPKDFDVLSIDIDGNDYHVWDALKDHRPKLVVIEFNPTIPNEIEFVQPREMRLAQGCSLRSLDALARSKGYSLIHATFGNAIFADRKYSECFGAEPVEASDYRADLSAVTYLFQTFEGKILLSGNRDMCWHNVRMDEKSMQAIPGYLQKYPDRYNLIQKVCWKVFHLWSKLTGRSR